LYTITGTAQPPETYTYGYESGTGFLWKKKAYGTGPWLTGYTDWMGRPIRNEFPTFNSNSVKLFQQFYYDNNYAHLTKETFKSGTTVGSAITVGASKLYWYDGNAKLTRTATDTNGNGSIDLDTDHNVMEYFGHFQKFSPDWYSYSGYGTYGTDGSSTLKTLEANYEKVSKFTVNTGSDSTISYSFTNNRFGDWTEDYVKLRRSQAKVVKQHYIDQAPSADLLVTQSVNINGLDVESLNTEGHLFSKHYDVIGRLILNIDGRDLETEYSYDTKGQLSWVEDSAGVRKTYYYDGSTGFMFKDTDDSGIEALYGYDLMGRVTHTYGRTPNPVRYEYTDPMGRMTKMETFRTGDFSTFSGFSGTSDETNWTYDTYSGLLKKKTDDKLKYSEYTYNALGQVLTRRDGRGVIVTNEYYASTNPGTGGMPNALKMVTYPSTGGYNNSANVQYTPDLLYTYKRHGGLYEVTEGSIGGPANKRNKRVFSYDSNYQLSQEDLGIYTNDIYHETNDVINYTYETSTYGFKGRPVSFNYRDDTTYKNSYTYDGTGRLDKITKFSHIDTVPNPDEIYSHEFDYTYHSTANVVDYLQYNYIKAPITTPTSTTVVSTGYKQDMVYRSDSYRLDKILHLWASESAKTQDTRLEYDAHGRRTYEKMQGTVVTTLGRPAAGYASKAEYDLRSQVDKYERYNINATTWAIGSAISNTNCDWVFDNEGNRDKETIAPAAQVEYTADELNQYTLIPGANPTYDDNGNMLTDGTRTMVYDAENRLVKVTIGANNWTYQYDYMGRRITLSANGTLQKKFVYQGWNLIAETNSSDTVGRKYTWGLDVSTTLQGAGGVGGLLMIQDGTAEYFPIYDGALNIVGLYNETGGIAAAYEYDAFGRIINDVNDVSKSGPYAASNPFRFSTKYTDEDTDLVYYGLRYYNPKIGRFINRDPIGESGGINLNAFVSNNPVNSYDYLGLTGEDCDEEEEDYWEADYIIWGYTRMALS
jgi:RHS repeat-associated protein